MEKNKLHETRFGLLNELQIRRKAKDFMHEWRSFNFQKQCLVCNESNCSYNDWCIKCGVFFKK